MLRLDSRFLAPAGLLLLMACESPPAAATLREWGPTDHDRTEVSSRPTGQQPQPRATSQAQAKAAPPKAAGNAPSRPDPLLEATWAQQCATCHGAIGHGDGPTGPMVHAANLTLADWQATVTDDQIAASIRAGKGKMPPFPDLPPQMVTGLVARIRALKGR